MKKLIILLIILIVVLMIVLLVISYTKNIVGTKSDLFFNQYSKQANTKKTTSLKFVSWNTAWFYGSGSEGGSDYRVKSREEFIESLDSAVELLNSLDADVISLQEVDFKSDKSHGINQAEYLAKKLKMNFAIANSWEHTYIPFPYFPIKNHFARVSSGGAILSKFQILDNSVTLFEKPKSNPWWYNLLYLFRYNQTITIQLTDRTLKISNVHLEAFDMANRSEQVTQLIKLNKDVDIIMGDFNMVPDSSDKKHGFVGYEEDDYRNDQSFRKFSESDFIGALNHKEFNKDKNLFYTFPANKPDRRLDYFYLNSKYKKFNSKVIKSSISDHLPIYLELNLE